MYHLVDLDHNYIWLHTKAQKRWLVVIDSKIYSKGHIHLYQQIFVWVTWHANAWIQHAVQRIVGILQSVSPAPHIVSYCYPQFWKLCWYHQVQLLFAPLVKLVTCEKSYTLLLNSFHHCAAEQFLACIYWHLNCLDWVNWISCRGKLAFGIDGEHIECSTHAPPSQSPMMLHPSPAFWTHPPSTSFIHFH